MVIRHTTTSTYNFFQYRKDGHKLMIENNDITQDRGNGIRRDSNMDIASLIKTAKTNTTEAPVAEEPVEEAPREKTPLEQMKEQKANQTKGPGCRQRRSES